MRHDHWTTPPGESRSPRRVAKTFIGSFLVGVLSIGIAWAGSGLVPIGADTPTETKTDPATSFVGVGSTTEEGSSTTSFSPADLEPGQILAGASKISLFPRPEDYRDDFPDAAWEQDQTECESGNAGSATHVADFRVRWGENPNCLYMGGYSIGPVNSITTWDEEYGLWVRSVAMQDAQGDATVLTLIDAVYWEAYYNSLCPNDPCGFLDLADQLAEETGLKPENFVFFSTHSHTAMDFIGGWGAVPDWYMQQATDSLKDAVRAALGSMEPAVLEAGEAVTRQWNNERRKHYHAAEDDTLSWFRLVDADGQAQSAECPGTGGGNEGRDKTNSACEPAAPGRAIATVGAYAAHPTTEDAEGGEGDADFPAVFAKRVEEAFGGTGMFLQTGLGNMVTEHVRDELVEKVDVGNALASAIPAIGGGSQITDTDIRVGRTAWDQPVTNIPLGSLGVGGFFDRTFNQAPASVNIGDSEYPHKKCNSASPISVETTVSAARIGELVITGGPGELFANLTNTIEEANAGGITLALGLANDGLGYIIQSFETDHVGRQGIGFVNGPLSEYEDAYSIDHCIGDAALEHTLELLNQLR
ncbi:MAG: hypothetical protein ACRDKT_04955 [Actinomycetota bacterium]